MGSTQVVARYGVGDPEPSSPARSRPIWAVQKTIVFQKKFLLRCKDCFSP